VSSQDNRSRRVWSAEEISEQLDEVAGALIQGSHELVRGFLLGAPRRPRPKPKRRQERGDEQQ
jgi:hypothetical protein